VRHITAIVVSTFVVGAVAIATAEDPPVFMLKWGTRGPMEGQFGSPLYVSVGQDSNVYVADSQNHRIQKFTGNGTFLTSWGQNGDGSNPGDFVHLIDICVGSDGSVFTLDYESCQTEPVNEFETRLAWI